MSERLLFMSDEWIAKAIELRAEMEKSVDRLPEPPVEIKINVTVSEIPHRDDLDGHIDTTGGRVVILEGQLEDADLAVETDYITAAELFTARGPEEFMESVMPAIFGGRIVVDGDLNRFLPLMQHQADTFDRMPPEAEEFGARLAAITEV